MLFRRRKSAGWIPPSRGTCSCAEHLDALLPVTLPLAAQFREDFEGESPLTIGELVQAQALAADPLPSPGQTLYDEATRQDVGTFHWSVWVGDEARVHYDDDAALTLEEAMEAQPTMGRVAQEDREVFYVTGPHMCAEGILAAVARALMDDRVRHP